MCSPFITSHARAWQGLPWPRAAALPGEPLAAGLGWRFLPAGLERSSAAEAQQWGWPDTQIRSVTSFSQRLLAEREPGLVLGPAGDQMANVLISHCAVILHPNLAFHGSRSEMCTVKYKAKQNHSSVTCSDGNSGLLLSSRVLNSRRFLFGFISQTQHYLVLWFHPGHLVRRNIISLWQFLFSSSTLPHFLHLQWGD